MKVRFVIGVVVISSFLAFAGVRTALAQWAALSSGYAVTTDSHGGIVYLDTDVTGWAGTTDPLVEKVHILWLKPDGTTFWDEWFEPLTDAYVTPAVPLGVPTEISDWAEKYQGISVRYAYDTIHIPLDPTLVGDWTFKAIFWDLTPPPQGENHEFFKVKATSFEVVPEVPFGTIAIILGWFGVFGIFALRRKHIPA